MEILKPYQNTPFYILSRSLLGFLPFLSFPLFWLRAEKFPIRDAEDSYFQFAAENIFLW
jgi:hypothetical protein